MRSAWIECSQTRTPASVALTSVQYATQPTSARRAGSRRASRLGAVAATLFAYSTSSSTELRTPFASSPLDSRSPRVTANLRDPRHRISSYISRTLASVAGIEYDPVGSTGASTTTNGSSTNSSSLRLSSHSSTNASARSHLTDSASGASHASPRLSPTTCWPSTPSNDALRCNGDHRGAGATCCKPRLGPEGPPNCHPQADTTTRAHLVIRMLLAFTRAQS
mmetsp:Transcript_2026/g.6147  ORF Transcript_2026/g.6147 Transcript_2026/m.6147 type:complete len:222 (+) Transcript_2026:922-1587(+)